MWGIQKNIGIIVLLFVCTGSYLVSFGSFLVPNILKKIQLMSMVENQGIVVNCDEILCGRGLFNLVFKPNSRWSSPQHLHVISQLLFIMFSLVVLPVLCLVVIIQLEHAQSLLQRLWNVSLSRGKFPWTLWSTLRGWLSRLDCQNAP